ncbi:SDR family NAD(P)-dependent oxidoreductase [bacterium]|nr:SDR family NAD(P)-dependent oxidoreductase [bacterium]
MTDLMGASALITGGARGIGYETARRLLLAGCQVTIWDINDKNLENAYKSLTAVGSPIHAHHCDVTMEEQVCRMAAKAKEEMGQVDILVNNAGSVMPGRFCSHPPSLHVKETQINLISMLYTINAFLPGMYERKHGHIVNVSSGAGLMGMADLAVYCATKWAVYGLTESLRFEAMMDGRHDVRFSSIHPGIIREGMFAGSRLNLLGEVLIPRVKNHDRIARVIVNQALKKNRQVVKYPRSLHLGILLRALLPDRILSRILLLAGGGSIMEAWKGHTNLEEC